MGSFDLWRVRRTLMEMMKDRGYIGVKQEDIDCTFEKFKFDFNPKRSENNSKENDSIVRSSLNFDLEKGCSYIHGNQLNGEQSESNRIGIYFPDDLKPGVSTIREIVESMEERNQNHALIIVAAGVTHSAKKAVMTLRTDFKQTIEIFEDEELLVNITKHKLVPEHTVQTLEEKNNLLAEYKLKEHELPRMKVTDPVARYYGLKRGQLVKITRKSPTAGRYITYRIVM